jgi:hypothetical protein
VKKPREYFSPPKMFTLRIRALLQVIFSADVPILLAAGLFSGHDSNGCKNTAVFNYRSSALRLSVVPDDSNEQVHQDYSGERNAMMSVVHR